MFSVLLTDSVFGVLLTATLYNFYRYYWFLPSPFNTNWLKVLSKRERYTSEYPFNSNLTCFAIGAVSFILQLALPLGFVVSKRFLTSQLSILDSLIICTIPAICTLCLSLLGLWTDYTGRRNVDMTVYPGSDDKELEHRYSLLGQEYKDFRMELIEETELGAQAYKIHFKAPPPEGSPFKDLITEVLPVSGLLAICLVGGSAGCFLFLT